MALDNIPRVDVTINDGGLRLSEPVAGPKVTLLGVTTGTNLTIGEPFLVPDLETGFLYAAEASGRPSELSKACEEAFMGGAKSVELVKIADTSGEACTLDQYQILFHRGPYYVSVTCYEPSEELVAAMRALAAAVDGATKGE